MNNRHLFPLGALAVALCAQPQMRAADGVPKEFSIPSKQGAPMHASLVWANSSLQAIEVRAKAGGALMQRIKVGESELVGCDLDQENLPANWIGTLDHNKDGYQDIYVQTAQGTDTPYAVLLFNPKKKQFVASKALAEVRGLDVSGGGSGAEMKTAARKLEHSFGVVSKAANQLPRLAISGPALEKGASFHIVSHDEQRVIDAEVVAARQPAADEVIPEGAASYTIELITSYSERIPDEEPFIGVAVFGPGDSVTRSGGKASAQLPGAPGGKRLFFRVCTSGEGMHMTAWSGKPLAGRRVWHAYHYLGYDVEPNCTPKDYPNE